MEWLEWVLREARSRWKDVSVDKVKARKTKLEVYMKVMGRPVKVVISLTGERKIRVYSPWTSVDLALKRIFARCIERYEKLREKGLIEQ